MLLLLFIAFMLALVVGFDVGYSMILAAWLGVEYRGDAVDTAMMPLSMIAGVDTYALVQVPLFILAGELMNRGGLTLRLIDWAQAIVGRVRGSLGHVSILTNLIMAGVSGSAVADAVATGKPLIPAMRKEGYGDGFAGAVIAAGALLGPIIPPSIPMVVYAQLASQSVVKLFMAGVVPGLLLAAGFMVVCSIVARVRNYPSRTPVPWAGKAKATGRAGWALLMPVIIIGGIRFGLVTDTEAAAVAVIYSLLVSLLIYRGLRYTEMPKLLFEAGRSTAVILFLLAAAGPFSWLVAESQVSQTVVATIHGPEPDDRPHASADRPAAVRGFQRRKNPHRAGDVGNTAVPGLGADRAGADHRIPAPDHLAAGTAQVARDLKAGPRDRRPYSGNLGCRRP